MKYSCWLYNTIPSLRTVIRTYASSRECGGSVTVLFSDSIPRMGLKCFHPKPPGMREPPSCNGPSPRGPSQWPHAYNGTIKCPPGMPEPPPRSGQSKPPGTMGKSTANVQRDTKATSYEGPVNSGPYGMPGLPSTLSKSIISLGPPWMPEPSLRSG